MLVGSFYLEVPKAEKKVSTLMKQPKGVRLRYGPGRVSLVKRERGRNLGPKGER